MNIRDSLKLVRYLSIDKWDYECLSENSEIISAFIKKKPDKPWNWSWLSKNPSI